MKPNWKFNNSAKDRSRLSYLIGYLENETMLKSLMGIDGSSFDFTRLAAEVKTSYLYRLTRNLHRGRPDVIGQDLFYSGISYRTTVLTHILNKKVLFYIPRIEKLLIPKFYHDRKDTNFLKELIFVGEKKQTDENIFLKHQVSA